MKCAARRPDLVVLDELACANALEARHPKRFQDVLEILEAGIDVLTTLNVYEIASRAELLWPVAGAASRQTVPDGILDKAAIVLVDLPPSELIQQRFKHGQIRFREGSGLEKSRLFEEESLMALREMTARLFVERAARDAQERRQASNVGGPAKAGHRVLVAIEADWDSEQLILWTRRLAGSLNAPWIVLYVETSRSIPSGEEARLTRNLELARELGAEVITTADEDLAGAVLRVAFSRNITQIVAGKTGPLRWWQPFARDRFVAQLIRGSGDIGVHVVPVKRGTPVKPLRRSLAGSGWLQYGVAMATVVKAGGPGRHFLVHSASWSPRHGIFVFGMAVVVLALFVERGPALLAAAISAAIWDYFFLPPVFDFRVSHVEDALLLGMYFQAALALWPVDPARIRAQKSGSERQREAPRHCPSICWAANWRKPPRWTKSSKRWRSMNWDAPLMPGVAGPAAGFLEQVAVAESRHTQLGQKEAGVAAWVLENRQSAGKFTGNASRR